MNENVAVVGAGIVGLAHAWSAAERGHSVTVFERSTVASGASIRNFGMVWPIGQPEPARSVALLSRDRWLKLTGDSGIWADPYGSLHLAHRPDEWAVLQEFCEIQRATVFGPHVRLLNGEQALQRSPAINPEGLLGAMECDLEICINPAETIRRIPRWLNERFGVNFRFGNSVVDVGTGRLKTAMGEVFGFDRIIICSGPDLDNLYPGLMAELPLTRCKLQMLRTVPQPEGWKSGAHLASGLSLRHYESFRCCTSLGALTERIADETPELDRYGIHVMASQDNLGRIVLGDSHQYGDQIEPFDSNLIDELILRELHKILRLPTWDLESRWHGLLVRSAGAISVQSSPEPGVHICNGMGGAGMTMSFGVAENNWREWNAEQGLPVQESQALNRQ